jgi:hypothetical protein
MTGALHTTKTLPEDAPAYQSILRNLSTVQYNLVVEAGETKSVSFPITLDMQPQDVRVQLYAVLADDKGTIVTVEAYNGSASIVEPPTSLLDPQMYAHPQQPSRSAILVP